MKFQKHKLITVGDNKIIVSDGEINSDDCWYVDDTNTIRKSITNDADYWKARKDYTKIIAQLPSEKTLDGIPLCEEIRAEELAEKLLQNQLNYYINEKHTQDECIDFIIGFKISMKISYNLSKSDGVFNESDMKRMFECGRNFQLTGENNFTELIESLQQRISLLCSDDGEPIMIDNTFKYRK